MVFNSLTAEPWGKDADLVNVIDPPKECATKIECSTSPISPIAVIAEGIINFHQNVISPADGPRSHYFPSSSQYMKEAIRYHGFLRGYLMGCDRLLRENSELWIYPTICHPERGWTKYDPVPKKI